MSTEQSNLHKGHRERLIKKFLSVPDQFSEHELLEVLLFYAVPRKDTNALAHKLLNVFGSLEGVFSAEPSALTSVDGVGEKVACMLSVMGAIMKRKDISIKKNVRLYTVAEAKEILFSMFKGQNTEKLVVLYLNKKYHLKGTSKFCDYDMLGVKAEVPELVDSLSANRSAYAIVAHNHPSNCAEPSDSDDLATKKLSILCEFYGITLIDHFIVTDNEIYSYRMEGRLEKVLEKAKLNVLFNNI
jgi:DNA repair protein RadC